MNLFSFFFILICLITLQFTRCLVMKTGKMEMSSAEGKEGRKSSTRLFFHKAFPILNWLPKYKYVFG